MLNSIKMALGTFKLEGHPMKEKNVANWDDFQREREGILEHLRKINYGTPGRLLFRGQPDSSWPLDTTLERYGKRAWRVRDYYRLISSVKSQIETFTDTKWDKFDHDEINKLSEEYDAFSRALRSGLLPGYKYMVYLRHHGFPSPLLDWTRSPYVAAYFAFSRLVGEYVSIYVYCETPRQWKVSSSDAPRIHHFGPNVSSHRRHFLQQSEYTACFVHNEEWLFAPHGPVVALDPYASDQDLLWKFNIPSSESAKVLMLLDEYNLNGYSLFGSVESLMETIATRALNLTY